MAVTVVIILIIVAFLTAVMCSCVIIGGEADDESERMFREFLIHKDMYKELSGMETHKNDK